MTGVSGREEPRPSSVDPTVLLVLTRKEGLADSAATGLESPPAVAVDVAGDSTAGSIELDCEASCDFGM